MPLQARHDSTPPTSWRPVVLSVCQTRRRYATGHLDSCRHVPAYSPVNSKRINGNGMRGHGLCVCRSFLNVHDADAEWLAWSPLSRLRA
ncbi:hypothetical protein IG631_07453 [Alternaria alternata]|nr:hypothetical protein IG631_07453 [Alternaria alternata]